MTDATTAASVFLNRETAAAVVAVYAAARFIFAERKTR